MQEIEGFIPSNDESNVVEEFRLRRGHDGLEKTTTIRMRCWKYYSNSDVYLKTHSNNDVGNIILDHAGRLRT